MQVARSDDSRVVHCHRRGFADLIDRPVTTDYAHTVLKFAEKLRLGHLARTQRDVDERNTRALAPRAGCLSSGLFLPPKVSFIVSIHSLTRPDLAASGLGVGYNVNLNLRRPLVAAEPPAPTELPEQPCTLYSAMMADARVPRRLLCRVFGLAAVPLTTPPTPTPAAAWPTPVAWSEQPGQGEQPWIPSSRLDVNRAKKHQPQYVANE